MAEQAPVVNEPVVPQDTTPADSTPVETNSPEVADDTSFDKGFDEEFGITPEVTEEPVEEAPIEPSTDDEPPVEQPKPEDQDKPLSKAEERKQQLNDEIRNLVAERNKIRSEVEKVNSQVYNPQTADQLLGQINPDTGEYFTPTEARLAALEQSREVEQYNSRVAEEQLTIRTEAQNALKDYPMFDQNNAEYNADIAKGVDELLGRSLEFDQNTGQVVGSKVSPYTLYQLVGDAFNQGKSSGQIAGQKATEKMIAAADTPSSAPVKEPKEDSFLKGFDRAD